MIKNDYVIRLETEKDYTKTEFLVREAFWNVYKPGCDEHFVLKCLRSDPAFIPQLDFVMEYGGEIIGQIIFVKADIVQNDGSVLPVATFGPVCIHPQYQKLGLGKILLDYALEKATEYGIGAVFIEGNIKFYSKCGLTYAENLGIGYGGVPAGTPTPFFLGKELQTGYLAGANGVYHTPKGYFASIERPEDFAEYEKQFPYKEKLKLPGQLV